MLPSEGCCNHKTRSRSCLWRKLGLDSPMRQRRIAAAGGRFPIDTESLRVSPSPQFQPLALGELLCAVSRASLAPLP